MKRKAILISLVLASIGCSRNSRTPPGQPPLVEMSTRALTDLQTEFNRTSNDLRVILLISPT